MEFWASKTLFWAPKTPNQIDPYPQFVLERLIAELEPTTGCFWWKALASCQCNKAQPLTFCLD